MADILLGISGGIASYKSAALCSRLVQGGWNVSVIMTDSALAFVGKATFEALSGRPVSTQVFDSRYPLGAHIALEKSSSLLVVAPATANFIGKAANGIADDLLSTTYLSFTKPILFAPAMNREMWEKPSVQRNIRQLEEDGVEMIGPESGWQSCRDQGMGRMTEPDGLFKAIQKRLS